ncbi:MAG: hypothetical protein QM786_19415 [Breznakibacter sp.]
MSKILMTVVLVFVAFAVQGQVGNQFYYETGYVHLKDGTTLKGRYIYSSDLEKIQVVTGKNTWVFNASEVAYISKKDDRQRPSMPDNVPRIDTAFASCKWFSHTQAGLLIGNPDNEQSAPLVLGTSMNYGFTKKLSAGAGVGVEFLKETYLPVTLNLMYKFRDARFTPFVSVTGGYQIPLEDSRISYSQVVPDYISSSWSGYWYNYQTRLKARGGALVNPAIGFISHSRSGYGFSLSVGYRYHRLNYKGEDSYRLDVDYNRLTVNLGLIIH